jgi:serine/threonine-protein kinase
MAQVFLAEDTLLRREVAIKLLYRHLLRDPLGKARFVREARAAAALDHPGILKVFDVDEGDEGGVPYIVMELLRGQTLKAFIDAGGAPLAELVALAGAGLCGALATAHAAGVIHRDVKPANVMCAGGGRLVLCDFGVARLLDDDALATQSGMVLGTPAYMAPEQALGHKVDERSDVYSLGATLYQMATGVPPFAGTSSAVIQDVIRGRFTPPLRRNPTIGADLAAVIERAMAREPAARFPTARELGAALDAVAAGLEARELASYFADPGGWNREMKPRIVAATMTRAREAAAARRTARALALAERVLAFDPAHAEANSLIARLGVATQRRRQGVWLVGGAMLLAAVGLGAVAMRGEATGNGQPATGDRPPATSELGAATAAVAGVGKGREATGDRRQATGDRQPATSEVDAATADFAGVDAAAVRGREATGDRRQATGDRQPATSEVDAATADFAGVDAAAVRGREATGDRRQATGDRQQATSEADVAPAPAPDPARVAAPVRRPRPEAAPQEPVPASIPAPAPPPAAEVATLEVKIRPWCDITVDGVPRGRSPNAAAITLPPGEHELGCEQTGQGRGYRDTLRLAPGERRLVARDLLGEVAVTVGITGAVVVIDGKTATPNAVVKLSPGRHRVELRRGETLVGAAYVHIPASPCTLRETPDLACYE